jgi:hypothetical protein
MQEKFCLPITIFELSQLYSNAAICFEIDPLHIFLQVLTYKGPNGFVSRKRNVIETLLIFD